MNLIAYRKAASPWLEQNQRTSMAEISQGTLLYEAGIDIWSYGNTS